MIDYSLVAAVAGVVRTGSFEKAARDLGITSSAVSQRVKLLEERLGTGLIIRGQPCTATSAGTRLCQHFEQVGLLEHTLTSDLGLSVGDGKPVPIRIAVNADSLATWFPDAIAHVDGRVFDLILDDERKNAEWLRRGEVSGAISTSPGPIHGCNSRMIGTMRYVAAASPDFIARWFAEGIDENSLCTAPCFAFNVADELNIDWIRNAYGFGLNPPVHWLPSPEAILRATIAGAGWSLSPEPPVKTAIADGSLVELPPHLRLEVKLYWHWARSVQSAIKNITAAIVEAARPLRSDKAYS